MSLSRLHRGYCRATTITAAACAAAFLLTGCKDENIIKAGMQLGADGKAAATGYSDFMMTTSDLVAAECDIRNFAFMLKVRASQGPVSNFKDNSNNCAQDLLKDEEYRGLVNWAKDGQAVAKAYAALARLTDNANAEHLQKSIDTTSNDIADAAKVTLDPRLSEALGALSGAVAHMKQADGILKFANAMKGVPEAMISTLSGGQRPEYYKHVYTDYDKHMSEARTFAYDAGIVDALAGTDKFVTRLGLTLNVPNRSDPYVAIFSRQYLNPPLVAEKGLAARDKLIESLKSLSAETDQVITMQTANPTLHDDLADLRQAIQVVKGILHPEAASSQSTKAK